jgi:hypothetical protein
MVRSPPNVNPPPVPALARETARNRRPDVLQTAKIPCWYALREASPENARAFSGKAETGFPSENATTQQNESVFSFLRN